jgi:hypothetical protein
MKKLAPGVQRKNPWITVNISPDTHRRASMIAASKGLRIGAYAEQVVLAAVQRDEAQPPKPNANGASKPRSASPARSRYR